MIDLSIADYERILLVSNVKISRLVKMGPSCYKYFTYFLSVLVIAYFSSLIFSCVPTAADG